MRRGIFILLVMLVLPHIKLVAQNPNLEKLNAYKIAFFTRRLNLTSNEAEKFWPVYNEFQDERNSILKERNSLIRDFNQNTNSLNDSQLTEMGDELLATMVKESDIGVKFHNQLKRILPPAKVIRFYLVENQYKAQLLKELQGNNQQQRMAPGRDL